jgi:hypothetical protein
VCAVGNQIHITDITASKATNSGADHIAVRTINSDHQKNICSFDFTADGAFLVALSEDKVCVYETSHWKLVTSHMPQIKAAGCAFIMGDKLRLLYGCYEEIFFWQCGATAVQPKKAGSQSGLVAGIACTLSNGQTVIATASHSKEKNLMLWTI